MWLDIALLVVFSVMAVRIARTIRAEAAIFREFNQPRTIGGLVLLFPLGPIILFLIPRIGWLPAVVLAGACYLPSLVVARRSITGFARAGTDRVHPARNAVYQAFGTALVGLIYVALITTFILASVSFGGVLNS